MRSQDSPSSAIVAYFWAAPRSGLFQEFLLPASTRFFTCTRWVTMYVGPAVSRRRAAGG
jgi:hypothetical protein